MSNVDLVKSAIEKLTPVECAELQHWLEQQNHDDQAIDSQLKADLEAGKLDELLNQAIADQKVWRSKTRRNMSGSGSGNTTSTTCLSINP
ncbi:MAG: hypothetical protein WB992_20170 [Bryobacteraceae bacterium]